MPVRTQAVLERYQQLEAQAVERETRLCDTCKKCERQALLLKSLANNYTLLLFMRLSSPPPPPVLEQKRQCDCLSTQYQELEAQQHSTLEQVGMAWTHTHTHTHTHMHVPIMCTYTCYLPLPSPCSSPPRKVCVVSGKSVWPDSRLSCSRSGPLPGTWSQSEVSHAHKVGTVSVAIRPEKYQPQKHAHECVLIRDTANTYIGYPYRQYLAQNKCPVGEPFCPRGTSSSLACSSAEKVPRGAGVCWCEGGRAGGGGGGVQA